MTNEWSTVNTAEPFGQHGNQPATSYDQYNGKRNSVYGEDREDLTPQAAYTAPPLLSTPILNKQFSSPTSQSPHHLSSNNDLQVEPPKTKAYSGPQLIMSPPLSLDDKTPEHTQPKDAAVYSPPNLPTCMFNTVLGGPTDRGSGNNLRPSPDRFDDVNAGMRRDEQRQIDSLQERKVSLENDCYALEKRLSELREEEARLNRRAQQLQQTIDLAENVNTQKSKVPLEDLEHRQRQLTEKEIYIREKEMEIREKEMEIRQKTMELESEADSLFQRKKELDLREFDINAAMPRNSRSDEVRSRKLAEKERELSIKEEELEQKKQEIEAEHLKAKSNSELARKMFAEARQVSGGGMEGRDQRFGSGSGSFEDEGRALNFSGELGDRKYSGDRKSLRHTGDQGFAYDQRRSREFKDDYRGPDVSGYSDPSRSRNYPNESRDYPNGKRRSRDYTTDTRDHPNDMRGPRDHPSDMRGPRDHPNDMRGHRDHPNDTRGHRDYPNDKREPWDDRGDPGYQYDRKPEYNSNEGYRQQYNYRPDRPFPPGNYPSISSGNGDGFHSQPSRPMASNASVGGGPSTLPNSAHHVSPNSKQGPSSRPPDGGTTHADTDADELFARMLQLEFNADIRQQDEQIAAEMGRPVGRTTQEEADYSEEMAFQAQLEMMGYTCAPGTPEYDRALKELKEELEKARKMEESKKRDEELAKKLAYQRDDTA